MSAQAPQTIIVTTWLLILHHRDRDRDRRSLGGLAVVAPETSYLAVRRIGADRIERAFATPAQWREMVQHLEHGLSSGTLATVLLGAKAADYVLQHLRVQDVGIDDPESAEAVLDAFLTAELSRLIVRPGGV